MVPTQGGDCYSTPLGWFESNEGGFQRLGRSSKHSIYVITYSLALSGTCADLLAMLMSKADHMLMKVVDCGRARALALNP